MFKRDVRRLIETGTNSRFVKEVSFKVELTVMLFQR